ncbi:hypothetical protein COO60DRAFT_1491228 [Scenedesmus sp. NREL 46B-D3]|nr:hypothetical protein COO60DRAFT_1491228 [Scenedesmus sp. NREL 46B-D3]
MAFSAPGLRSAGLICVGCHTFARIQAHQQEATLPPYAPGGMGPVPVPADATEQRRPPQLPLLVYPALLSSSHVTDEALSASCTMKHRRQRRVPAHGVSHHELQTTRRAAQPLTCFLALPPAAASMPCSSTARCTAGELPCTTTVLLVDCVLAACPGPQRRTQCQAGHTRTQLMLGTGAAVSSCKLGCPQTLS